MTKYKYKKYKNPFFKNNQNKKIYFSLKLKLILSCAILFILTMVWFFCFSNVFKIKQININGLTQISQQEIQNLIQEQIKEHCLIFSSQNNLILFNAGRLSEALNEKYCFEKIIIKKKLPDKLIINILEKPYAFIWHEKDKYYFTSADHCVINEINILDIHMKEYPIIYNEIETKVVNPVNKKINIDFNYTKYIIELFKQFNNYDQSEKIQDTTRGFKIEKFIIDKDINTIKMVILNGPKIYFSITEDLTKQINKFIAIKNQVLKNNLLNINYVDLRYGDKVYYK